jgi:thiol:disulfide interchange protein
MRSEVQTSNRATVDAGPHETPFFFEQCGESERVHRWTARSGSLLQTSAPAAVNRLPASRMREKAKCAACKAPLLPLTRPIALGSAQDFDELVRDASAPVLVDFWAAWCGPCRMVAPELEKIAG